MNTKNIARTVAVGALAFGMVAGAAAMATAAPQSNGSDGPIHIWDGITFELRDAPAYTFAYDEAINFAGSTTDFLEPVTCPAGSTGAYTFATQPGTERGGKNVWQAYQNSGFNPNPVVPGANEVLMAAPVLESQSIGAPAPIKANGGTWSLGLACTNNDGLTTIGAYYRTITVTAGTGAYTVAPVDAGPVVVPPAPAGTTGDISLSASTLGATNGTLGLSVPAGASATFGAPTLVGNKSTTTGTLPEVKVVDGRVVTHEGWTLNAKVKEFVNAANPADKIAAKQLGFAPKINAATSTSTGAVAGAAQAAGSAVDNAVFAEAAAGAGTGDTVIGGDLTFVAPQDKAAGTYTSTMTLTVVSK